MKKIIVCAIMLFSMLSLCACVKEHMDIGKYANVPPKTEVSKGNIGLNFVEMHNSIIDEMSKEYLPFFFVKNNAFDISGENEEPKKIIITADCLQGTTKQDVDLFLSYVLIAIGQNASEQNFKYQAPTEIEDGDIEGSFITYADFGSVFNEYALILKVTEEGKKDIYNMEIKPGEKIPISSKYWRE